MIAASNISKRFGPLTVLNDVSFQLETGGVYAVLGPNGSGKSTVLKIILGMVIPQAGRLQFDGVEIERKWRYREHISYLPQIARFPDNLRVRELINMIKDIRPAPSREKELIDRFGLEPFLNKRLGNLSGGTRQKVNIVLAFMYDAPVLILSLIHISEPTRPY